MAQHKYIPNFNNWVTLNENSSDFAEVEKRVAELKAELTPLINNNSFTTRDVMDWFLKMLELYDTTSYTIYIYKEMAAILGPNYRKFEKIFRKANTDLTREDIAAIIKYKKIADVEDRAQNDADSVLRELGLI